MKSLCSGSVATSFSLRAYMHKYTVGSFYFIFLFWYDSTIADLYIRVWPNHSHILNWKRNKNKYLFKSAGALCMRHINASRTSECLSRERERGRSDSARAETTTKKWNDYVCIQMFFTYFQWMCMENCLFHSFVGCLCLLVLFTVLLCPRLYALFLSVAY